MKKRKINKLKTTFNLKFEFFIKEIELDLKTTIF